MPGSPRRTLVASLAALFLLGGSAVGTNAILVSTPPTAFAVFESAPREADLSMQSIFDALAVPRAGEARVLMQEGGTSLVGVRAPEGSGDVVRAADGFAPIVGPLPPEPLKADNPTPPAVEVCLWVVTDEAMRGRCDTEAKFLSRGLAVSLPEPTRETLASWTADGATQIDHIASGPTTLEALRALRISAIEDIDEPAPQLDAIDAAAIRYFATGEELITPRQIAVSDGWRLSAGVYRPKPEAGLVVCISVYPEVGFAEEGYGGCTPIAVFSQEGVQSSLSGSEGELVAWSWLPDGSASVTVP